MDVDLRGRRVYVTDVLGKTRWVKILDAVDSGLFVEFSTGTQGLILFSAIVLIEWEKVDASKAEETEAEAA